MDYKALAQAAIDARQNAYAPYSRYRVGAALLAEDGVVYTGCNVESAAHSPGCCAERVAVYNAVSQGVRSFAAIAVAGGRENAAPEYCFPCGVCRQVLSEFAGAGFDVVVVKTPEDYRVFKLAELLPHAFGPEDLGASQ